MNNYSYSGPSIRDKYIHHLMYFIEAVNAHLFPILWSPLTLYINNSTLIIIIHIHE